jgi:membrane protease YdiL (CAAX protease family)
MMLKNRYTCELQVIGSGILFAFLLGARETAQFSQFFDLLPVLGGSTPYFVLTLCWILIFKSSGRQLSELGLKRTDMGNSPLSSFFKLALWLIGIILLSLVCGSIVVELFDIFQGPLSQEVARKSPLVGNLTLLLILTPLMWVAVFAEELLFRGLILNYLAARLGKTTFGWMLAIVITSIIFGIAHVWQGSRGMVGAGILGLIWGMAYYFSGRNLWPATLAHCATNTIGFISTYQS